MNEYFNIALWEYDFYSPHYLWLLLLVPLILFIHHSYQNKNTNFIKFTGTDDQQSKYNFWSIRWLRYLIHVLFAFAFICIIIPFSQPYNVNINPPKIDYKNGIDIILSIDASGSMLAQDFDPNRLEVAKEVAKKFVDSRKGDRIGLVVYEGEAYTACPATLDYELLKNQISAIEPGSLEPGTAIGNGLGVAVTRLRSDSLVSKVIILLTDGSNNAGSIEPLEATQLAKAKNCKVYTIGVGGHGMAPTPMNTPFGIIYQNMPVEIDENLLKEIAKETGGKYFRATDERSLEEIYKDIDKLEKRKMEDQHIGQQPPITIIPFFIWASLAILVIFAIKRWKFRLDE
jgi:Ca-activated chloride channel family protein